MNGAKCRRQGFSLLALQGKGSRLLGTLVPLADAINPLHKLLGVVAPG
jgi:hypothetical protein